MQFTKHCGFQYQLFSLLSGRAAFVYCAKERHFQRSDLKMFKHRLYKKFKQGPNISHFKDLNVPFPKHLLSKHNCINDNQELLQKMVDARKEKRAARLRLYRYIVISR